MTIMRKYIAFLVSVILVFGCLVGPSMFVSADGENCITAELNQSMRQGDSAYCYVYIDSLSGVGSLDVCVYFDPDKVNIRSTYNSASAILYDSSVSENCVRYTYLFDGNGTDRRSQLFAFRYRILDTAEVGKTYFDIAVSDAYSSDLQPIEVYGARVSVDISEKMQSKSCSVTSSSSVSSSFGEEFTLTYNVSTANIASGSFEIHYDNELFELVGIENGHFLSNKIADVNSDLTGAVYCSFVGTEYNYYYDLISVTFRTVKNVSETSEITFGSTDFYDLDLIPVVCSGCSTSVDIAYDSSIVPDAPCVRLSSEYDASNDQVVCTVSIDADMKLGAGDFTLSFDADLLTFASFEKLFTPSFFNVNTKKTDEGTLKFSIISLSDIVDETQALKVVFDVVHPETDTETELSISGSGVADSMTDPITVNYIGSKIVIDGVPDADYTEYDKAVALAVSLVQSDYTADSWKALQDALAVDVSGLKITDQKTVDDAAAAISAAISSLAPTAKIVLGDFDRDGFFTSADLIYACQLDAGIISESAGNVEAIDVDGDGVFTSADLIYMCQYDAGIIGIWPAEKVDTE